MKQKNKWDVYKSKWKAALEKDLDVSLKGDENILYLGASTGSTISHLKDQTKGIIFAVEKSNKMTIELIKLAEKSENIAVIFQDARNTDEIKKRLYGQKIDVLFQDIPSRDQIEILARASELVDKNCKILLSLKTQSISQKKPEKVLKIAQEKLENHFKILETVSLEPYHQKHYFFILKKL